MAAARARRARALSGFQVKSGLRGPGPPFTPMITRSPLAAANRLAASHSRAPSTNL